MTIRGLHAAGARSISQFLVDLESNGSGSPDPRLRPLPTGFDPLDRVLEGGLRAQDLTLIGGLPGVGKTVATLQWARHMALEGHTAIYACYEHDEPALVARLLTLELGNLGRGISAGDLPELRAVINEVALGGRTMEDACENSPMLQDAHARLTSYADRLWLVRASGVHTGLTELEQLIVDNGADQPALFVDYLQKVAVRPEPEKETEKVTRVVEGLKELALKHDVAVVAVVAADRAGLTARRLRLHHLRGSSALAYEADVAIILNDKSQAVSKVHLAYDPVRAEEFTRQVVFSVEKNRGGPALLDLEFRKDFEHFRFEPVGGHVAERLVDERLYAE